MSILLIQNWDIIHGKEEEYAKFITEVYIPETTGIGIISVGGFYVEVGFGPRVIAVHSVNEMGELLKALTDTTFKNLAKELRKYVYNLRRYVLEPTGAAQKGKYTIQKGVWKFNQYYDLRPGVKKSYAEFLVNEYIPAMEKIDYVKVTGGWNVVLGGFSEIIAEFTFADSIDIGRLLANEDFRKISLRLKNEYATNYMSRIIRCTERFDEPRWFKV
ncbi:MAG TPA: hypothetical protein PKK79_08435 [Syntrophorhabdaceae bacterium]|jgi:hypothetical protein|nr:hypothetical protein [Syntrophorhabdaceae bacterium]